jgi:hypothetical protein
MKAKGYALAMVFLSFLPGCNLFRRDLIGSGVFRLETVGVVGCEIAATAVERGGKLYLDGLIRGIRLTTPVEGEVEVWLRTPDGTETEKGRAVIRSVSHRRTGHSHPRFEITFNELPPPGTVIMALPRYPRCLPASPRGDEGRPGEK